MTDDGVSPLPELRTERLTLRAYTDHDAARVLDIHSRLDVVRWLDNPPFTLMSDLDEAREWIAGWARVHTDDARCGGWAVEVRATGVVAGTVLVTALPGDELGRLQVGWHLHPDAAGHGYASEAAVAVIDRAFDVGVDVLWCDMYPDNEPSARLARRLGLSELGVRPDPWYGGESLMFSVTADRWRALRGRADDPVR